MHKFLPVSIRYIFWVFVTGVLFFTAFRVLLYCVNLELLHHVEGKAGVVLRSFVMGFRFDTVISGYILALPAVVLVILELSNVISRTVLKAVHLFIALFYIVGFFICTADIPFFNNYNNRLNVTILNWTSSPGFMIKMVIQDKILLGYFLLFVLLAGVYAWVMAKIYRYFKRLEWRRERKTQNLFAAKFGVSLLFFCLMFLGIRGRTDEKSPITVGTAYFSSYNFPNQAGLNPVFTFIRSWLDGMKDSNHRLELMDDTAALKLALRYLGLPQGNLNKKFPFQRNITGTTLQKNYNVVVVLMESMSADYLTRFGNPLGLTPNIDRLANEGYSFDHFYSAGIHTFNGIFSSLYAFPALMARHTMEGAVIPEYTGLPWLMKSRGYETNFFMTHDDQFDNIGGFLTANHFNRIVSKKDYPSGEVKSTLGVPDHIMFRFALPVLNEYYRQNKPFLGVFMTTSNHDPYVIPSDIPFKPRHTDIRGGCVEYADWAIGDFMSRAAKEPWFSNTIFIFTGDHGAWYGDPYGDFPLSYNHIPCLIYLPMDTQRHKVFNCPGGQIDLFPTIAGILGGDYSNNTLGIDLLREKRPFMFFSQDDKVGVADENEFYIWRTMGRESLYSFGDKGTNKFIASRKTDSMKNYTFAMVQSAQWLLNNKATGPGIKK